jgi:hypothetical protein
MRGELLKLGIHVCKRTIQKDMRNARTPRSRGQSWATFLRHPAGQIWACDFLQVTDLCFRSLFAFFIIERKSRKVHGEAPADRLWGVQGRRTSAGVQQAVGYLCASSTMEEAAASLSRLLPVQLPLSQTENLFKQAVRVQRR